MLIRITPLYIISSINSSLCVTRYKELKKENETLKQELETLETGREELQSKVEDFYLIYYV